MNRKKFLTTGVFGMIGSMFKPLNADQKEYGMEAAICLWKIDYKEKVKDDIGFEVVYGNGPMLSLDDVLKVSIEDWKEFRKRNELASEEWIEERLNMIRGAEYVIVYDGEILEAITASWESDDWWEVVNFGLYGEGAMTIEKAIENIKSEFISKFYLREFKTS